MRVRVLPATIGVAATLLLSKSLGLALAVLPTGWTIHDAVVPVALAAPASEAGHPPTAPSQPHTPAPSLTPPASFKPPAPSDPPPPAVSDEERRLLQDLRTRRQEWEAKDRTLAEREGVLGAAEQRLLARASELAVLQSRLEQLEKGRSDRDDANWAGLVKVYEAMKPRDAATIFNDMDMPVLLQLVDRMKELKASLILAAMQPDRARLVTAQLAAKRSRTTALDRSDTSSEGPPHS